MKNRHIRFYYDDSFIQAHTVIRILFNSEYGLHIRTYHRHEQLFAQFNFRRLHLNFEFLAFANRQLILLVPFNHKHRQHILLLWTNFCRIKNFGQESTFFPFILI